MKKLTARLIAMLLVVALCGAMLPAAAATQTQPGTFKDVGPSHWAYAYVEQAVAQGLFQGTGADSFSPDLTMDRAMFVTVLSRMAGQSPEAGDSSFADVPADAWYAGPVAWAVEQGITAGVAADRFDPQGGVSRQQAATFLYRYLLAAGLELEQGPAPEFTDGDAIAPYAREAVAALAAAGILEGYADGSFLPEKTLTRAEAAALFVRFDLGAQLPRDTFAVSFIGQGVRVLVDGVHTNFCAVEEGSSLAFTLELAEGYRLLSVNGPEGPLSPAEDGSYLLENISADASVTILTENISPESYLVEFLGENVRFEADGQELSSLLLQAGQELSFRLLVDEGYALAQLSAENATLEENADGSYTLKELTGNAKVYAVAAPLQSPEEPEEYTVSFVTDEGLKVLVDGAECSQTLVRSDELSLSFTVVMAQAHTQVASATAEPAGSLYPAGSTFVLTGIQGDTTVTLTTGPEMLDVAFHTPYGASPVEPVQVAYGQTLSLPADPSLEGYFFGGWYTDKDLFYDFRPEKPVTEDLVLYAGFGQVVDTVHYDSIVGSNENDGATRETSVASMSWALKLAEHSVTKSIIMHYAAPVITNVEEYWDASHIDGGISVYMDPETYTTQGTWAIYTTTGKLTVNNLHFYCEDATEFKGAVFLYNYSGYDAEIDDYTYGDTTLINCSATGFGNAPNLELNAGGFFNDAIYNLGTLTMIGGEYYGNKGPTGGVVCNYHGYSNFYADGVYFHDNTARYYPDGFPNAEGQGGAIWINCWVAEIKNCIFENNYAEVGGGAISFGTVDELVLEGNVFRGNRTDGVGGAVYGRTSTSQLSLGPGNEFLDNQAQGNGGAIYMGRDMSLDQGLFQGNSASLGRDLYVSGTLTLNPQQGKLLQLDGGLTAGKGVKTTASLSSLEGKLPLQPSTVAPGTILVSGQDYILTEADLAKVQVSAEAEIVLDTDRNAIKVAEAPPQEEPDEPVEDEIDGPHNLAAVYVSGSGSDSNDGTSAGTAVATFAKAKSLLARDGTIYVTGMVTITGNKMLSLDPAQYGSAKIVRNSTFTNGNLIAVRGSLLLKNIVIDGGNLSGSGALIGSSTSAGSNTFILGEGCVLQNFIKSGSYGAAVNAQNAGDTIQILSGAEIRNGQASGSYSGMFRAENIVMSGGKIHNCSGSGNYGGAILGGKSITMSGGEIYDCSATASYAGLIYAQSGGSFNMSGGKIYNNSVRNMIGHQGNAAFDFSGGEIYGNNGTSMIGTNYSGGTILLGEVKIHDNVSSSGTITVPGSTTVTLAGAEIYNNRANQGGAVYLNGSNTYLELKYGKLYGNSANQGDEIYVARQKTLTIQPGSAGLLVDGEIYLANSGSYFASEGNLMGNLDNLQGKLLFNFQNPKEGVVVAQPVEGCSLTQADLDKIGSAGCNVGYALDDAGRVVTRLIPLEALSLDQTELSLMATYSGSLTASISPANASSTNLSWTSSDPTVAKVSGSGLSATVTGVGPGTATITAAATDGSGLEAKCQVSVTENTTPVESLTLNLNSHDMRVEQSVSLTATVNPNNAANQTLEWSLSDPSLVEAEESGKSLRLTAIAPGELTVTVSTTDGTGLSARCVIRIEPRIEIESVSLDKTEYRLDDGESFTLSATVNPTDAWDTSISWSVSDPAILALQGSGSRVTVLALADGNATVTATTADGKTASCAVTVADFPVTGLEIDVASRVTLGDVINLTARVLPANAANQKVSWSLSDPAVAQVVYYGDKAVLLGLAQGSVTVTATSDDGGFVCRQEVQVQPVSNNTMHLDLEELDLVIHQSFNVTALFEELGQEVSWSSNNVDVVDIQSVQNNQVTLKAQGVGGATVTATAADGQTASIYVEVTGRISGTLDEVYVSPEGSDSNDGATADTPVLTLNKAIELCGVDGTIYALGRNLRINGDANITMPREIYGDARIIMTHTYKEEVVEFPWGPELEIEEYSPTILLMGNRTQFSDVTFIWEQGNAANILGLSAQKEVVISNGAVFQGCGDTKYSQNLVYAYGDSRLLINGGEIRNFRHGSQLIWARERSFVWVNGGSFVDNKCQVINLDGASCGIEVNGGVFENNLGAPLRISYAELGLYGGTFRNNQPSDRHSTMVTTYGNSQVRIESKYPLVTENAGIYPGTAEASIQLGQLNRLEGSIGFYMSSRDAVDGRVVATGLDGRALTWAELAKWHLVDIPNTTLELDLSQNRFVLRK